MKEFLWLTYRRSGVGDGYMNSFKHVSNSQVVFLIYQLVTPQWVSEACTLPYRFRCWMGLHVTVCSGRN